MSQQASPSPAEVHDERDAHVLERHEGPIRTPAQLIGVVVASFVVPVVGIIMLAHFVAFAPKPGAGTDSLSDPKAVAERIAPVARLEWKDAAAPKVLKTGAEVYNLQCVACHASGAAGAPKFGDAAAWAPRIKTGYDALLNSVLKGKGAMAAQAGGDHDEVELARAMVHMLNAAGGKFDEPKAPAAAAASAAAAVASAPAAAAAPSVATAPAAAPAAVPAPAPAVAAAPAAAPAAAGGGEALYKQACAVCHVAGVAGAPKFGDKAAWAPRIGQGAAALTASVVKGKGAMPPKGGSAASESEIRAAVDYMLAAVK
jgi:cytochrome c5